MMRRIIVGALFSLLAISSCSNKNSYAVVEDGNLRLMAIRTKKEGTLKVRIAFSKYDEGLNLERFATAMQYQVDSCFYVSHEGLKTYPLYVTPIANGLDKTFEYLLGFEKEALASGVLVFEDRHRSKKNIELTFK